MNRWTIFLFSTLLLLARQSSGQAIDTLIHEMEVKPVDYYSSTIKRSNLDNLFTFLKNAKPPNTYLDENAVNNEFKQLGDSTKRIDIGFYEGHDKAAHPIIICVLFVEDSTNIFKPVPLDSIPLRYEVQTQRYTGRAIGASKNFKDKKEFVVIVEYGTPCLDGHCISYNYYFYDWVDIPTRQPKLLRTEKR